jgi:mRNA degradation ribonuclease J1/J2
MEDIFNRAERRLVVSCFSSSIHRIQLVLDLSAGVRPQAWRLSDAA